MNKACRLFFWGYLFVFFRLQIGIDILAAPIGYYLIYSGARLLAEQYPVAKKVKLTAFIGVLISVPGVFVDLSEVRDIGWILYAETLFIWKVIVVYYLFGTWKSRIREPGQAHLHNRVHMAYVWYMSIHFLMMLLTAFSLNFGDHAFSTFFIIVSFVVVAMDIMLLFLIASLRKVDWSEYETNETSLD